MNDFAWLTDEIGSPQWWTELQQQGTPRIEPEENDRCRVTFFWRDPQGDETRSATRRLWINITGMTDHHQPEPPRSLERIPQSDVWYWQTSLPADWRGSYCFIPDSSTSQPVASDDLLARRSWWQQRFAAAISDPLNPLKRWSGGRGLEVSPLHLPKAPPQTAWQAYDRGKVTPPKLYSFIWQSKILANQRRVWVWDSGIRQHRQRPLALLLDGQFWAQQMPVSCALQALEAQGRLPPALYILPDIIDREHRGQELPCNPQFWQAIGDELLPKISENFAWDHSAEQTVVAGQSFGGLAATYALLNRPDLFGKAISLSGSFWWPTRGDCQGELLKQLAAVRYPSAPRQLYLAAGRYEKLIYAANLAIQPLLTQQQVPYSFTSVEGGHDALWWRGSLLDGLESVWKTYLGD